MSLAKLKAALAGNKQPAARQRNEPMAGGRRAAENENPYLAARRTWNDHTRGVVAARNAWQMLALLAMLITLTAVGGVVFIGSQSKFVPYIVEVDKLGQPMAYAPAQQASAVPATAMAAGAAAFISDARTVTPDVEMQRKTVYRVYAMLKQRDPAAMKMNEWMNGSPASNPFARAGTEMVSVEINTALPQTENTYQVDWVETVRDRQGILKMQMRMRAMVTLYVEPPTSNTPETQVRMNALGIYARDFSWSRQL